MDYASSDDLGFISTGDKSHGRDSGDRPSAERVVFHRTPTATSGAHYGRDEVEAVEVSVSEGLRTREVPISDGEQPHEAVFRRVDGSGDPQISDPGRLREGSRVSSSDSEGERDLQELLGHGAASELLEKSEHDLRTTGDNAKRPVQRQEDGNGVLASSSTSISRDGRQLETIDVTHLQYASGELERARKNLAALKVLKAHVPGDALTPDEVRALLGWSGWGGASKVFNFNAEGEFLEIQNSLKELLSTSEYRDAQHSCLTAFYTPSEIIRPIYKVLDEHKLFDKERDIRVLEPSCGIGNIKAFAPKNTTFDMVELDSTTAQIAELIHTDARVLNCGYEDTELNGNGYDLAISNVPFGNIKIKNTGLYISDWFANRMIEDTAQNGISVVVANSGLMDKKSTRARFLMSQNADLMASVRLPRSVFKKHGTDNVTTDILVFRKREIARQNSYPDWVDAVTPIETEDSISINKYVYENRQNTVLGKLEVATRKFGKVFDVVEDKNHNLEDAIYNSLNNQITRYIQQNNLENASLGEYLADENDTIVTQMQSTLTQTVGHYVIDDKTGEIYFDAGATKEAVELPKNDHGVFKDLLILFNELEKTKDLQYSAAAEDTVQQAIADLKALYDRFVVLHGRIADLNVKRRYKSLKSTTFLNDVIGLELVDKQGKFTDVADVLKKRVVSARLIVPDYVENTTDALHLCLETKNEVDLDFIAQISHRDKETCITELEGQIFFDGDIWTTQEVLCSGLVAKKLEKVNAKIHGLTDVRLEAANTAWLSQFSFENNNLLEHEAKQVSLNNIEESISSVLLTTHIRAEEQGRKHQELKEVLDKLEQTEDYACVVDPKTATAAIPVNFAYTKLKSYIHDNIRMFHYDYVRNTRPQDGFDATLAVRVISECKNIEHLFPKLDVPLEDFLEIARIYRGTSIRSLKKDPNQNFFKTNMSLELIGALSQTGDFDMFRYLLVSKGVDDTYIKTYLKVEQYALKHDRKTSVLADCVEGFVDMDDTELDALVARLKENNKALAEYCYIAHIERIKGNEIEPFDQYQENKEAYLAQNIKKLDEKEETELAYLKSSKEALEKAQPVPLELRDIKDISLASTFLTAEDISEFIFEEYVKLDALFSYSTERKRFYENLTGTKDKEYFCAVRRDDKGYLSLNTNKSKYLSAPAKELQETGRNSKRASFGFSDNALAMTFFPPENYPQGQAIYLDGLISALISGKVPTIKQDEKTIDSDQSYKAWMQAQEIQKSFRAWIEKSPARRADIAKRYNDSMNRQVPVKFDGSYLTFPGMNPEIELRANQKNAVARCLRSEHGTLLAHAVGGGKTFEGITVCMEARRLGKANKPLLVVPNNLVEQWQDEFVRLYPNAKILVMTEDIKKNEEAKARFWGLAKNGSYDAVIVPMSQFDLMSLSEPLLRSYADKEAEELCYYAKKKDWSSKEYAEERIRLARQVEKIIYKGKPNSKGKTEYAIKFDEFDFDMLVVDEAHAYKNIKYPGRISSAGINKSDATRAELMKYKTMYMHQQGLTNNIVFMTGTPITNTLSELYVMQNMLAPQTLSDMGIHNIDEWLYVFAELSVEMEMKAEGSGFALKERVKRYTNLPELMNSVHGFMDIVTREDLKNLGYTNPPKVEHETVVVDGPLVVEKAKAWFAMRGAMLASKKPLILDRGGYKIQDNPLSICNDARKVSLSARLLDPYNEDLETEVSGKLNSCVDKVVDVYNATTHSPDGTAINGSQMIFCDTSTGADSTKFNAADYIKEELINRGIPAAQIAVISSAVSLEKRDKIYKALNTGDIRVAIGSSQTLGTGVSAQERLAAIHNLDCPWKPSDLEQRLGRIERDGNSFKDCDWFTCKSYTYVVQGSFDDYMYSVAERKAHMMAQVLTNQSPDRSITDISDTTLQLQEIRALTSDSDVLQKMMEQEAEVTRLKLEYSKYSDRQTINKKKEAIALSEINSTQAFVENFGELATRINVAVEKLSDIKALKEQSEENKGLWEGITLESTVYPGDSRDSLKLAQKDISNAMEKALRTGAVNTDLGTWCDMTFGVTWRGSDKVEPYLYLKDPKTNQTFKCPEAARLVHEINAGIKKLPITSLKACLESFVKVYSHHNNRYSKAQHELKEAQAALGEEFDGDKLKEIEVLEKEIGYSMLTAQKELEDLMKQNIGRKIPTSYDFLTMYVEREFNDFVYELFGDRKAEIQAQAEQDPETTVTFYYKEQETVMSAGRLAELIQAIEKKRLPQMQEQDMNPITDDKRLQLVAALNTQRPLEPNMRQLTLRYNSTVDDMSYFMSEYDPEKKNAYGLVFDPQDKDTPLYWGYAKLPEEFMEAGEAFMVVDDDFQECTPMDLISEFEQKIDRDKIVDAFGEYQVLSAKDPVISKEEIESLRQKLMNSAFDSEPLVLDDKEKALLENLITDEELLVRMGVAKQGVGLDRLVDDYEPRVREIVARQGYGLDTLINDKHAHVRREVARQGYGLEQLVSDEDWQVRYQVARQGYGLEQLVSDEHWSVRYAVAQRGYGLDRLIHDESVFVRREVARQGYGLETLINDEDADVRETVAKQGYGLDTLINDEHWAVRAAVASKGYGLDTLIKDEEWKVRAAVAEQGYGLDRLVGDEDPFVSAAAQEKLDELEQEDTDYSYESVKESAEVAVEDPVEPVVNEIDQDSEITRRVHQVAQTKLEEVEQKIEDVEAERDEDLETIRQFLLDTVHINNYTPALTAEAKAYLPLLVDDVNADVRTAVAKQGVALDVLINDEDPLVRAAVAEQGYGLDRLINDEYSDVRQVVAEQGYGLDKLVNDKHWRVRQAVAEQGYGLEVLVSDKNEYVRQAVAEQGHGLDRLVNDESVFVRREVARQGFGLEELINDANSSVRETVANQGYGLETLINDSDNTVRYSVAKQGYGLDTLINDEHWAVRAAVAEQGYGLDVLVGDEEWLVRDAAEFTAKRLGIDLESYAEEIEDTTIGDVEVEEQIEPAIPVEDSEETATPEVVSDAEEVVAPVAEETEEAVQPEQSGEIMEEAYEIVEDESEAVEVQDVQVEAPGDLVAQLLNNPQDFVANQDNLKWLAEKLGITSEFDKVYGRSYTGLFAYENVQEDGSVAVDYHLDELEKRDIASLFAYTRDMQDKHILIPQALIEADETGVFADEIEAHSTTLPYVLGVLSLDQGDGASMQCLVIPTDQAVSEVFAGSAITLKELVEKFGSDLSHTNYSFTPLFAGMDQVYERGLLNGNLVKSNNSQGEDVLVPFVHKMIDVYRSVPENERGDHLRDPQEMCGYIDGATHMCMPVYNADDKESYSYAFAHFYNPLGMGDYYVVAKDESDPNCVWCLCGINSLDLKKVNVKEEIAGVNLGFGMGFAKDDGFVRGVNTDQVKQKFSQRFETMSQAVQRDLA